LAGVYDEIVVDPCYPQWAEYLHGLWSADGAGVHDVLDVCCGTGLMAGELVSRGYRVVGIDGSAAMLDRARALLGPRAELSLQTLPALLVDGVFDAAISTFDGLNYLTASDLGATLVAVAEHLRPGGWLTFDLHTDAMMEFTSANPLVHGSDQGHTFSIVSDVDLGARTCDTRVEITTAGEGEPFIEIHRQYFHSDHQVQAALTRAGFVDIAVTEEYTDNPADDATLRATWTARLPTSPSS
jgi:SAM-dependent methyltransferase